jgi:uncharacterized protein YbaR (Trm112 family)
MASTALNAVSSAVRTGRSLASDVARIRSEARLARAHPGAEGLVLDLGGGQSPHARADIVVDKYVVDDFERPGAAALSFARPLVVADGEALPFSDGAFSYVVAQHVLEHAVDPKRMAAELARVADAGFIQVPTRLSERTYGWPFHPWFIDRRGDTLIFTPKPAEAAHDAPDQEMHDLFAESPLTRVAWFAHRSRWHHSVHWKGQIDVEVAGAPQQHEQADIDLERTLSVLREATAAGRTTPVGPQLRAVLCCPADRGELAWDADRVRCAACERVYPVAGDVPILLEQAVL